MWWLAFIPDEWLQLFVHAVAILGIVLAVVGTIAHKIPFISSYGNIAKFSGIVILLIGVFFEGGYGVEMSWRERVHEMEQKVAAAKEESDAANAALEVERLKKQKVITQQVEVIQKEIEVQKEYIDKECKVPDEAISIYRKSIAGPKGGNK
jgi:hypothetical protein